MLDFPRQILVLAGFRFVIVGVIGYSGLTLPLVPTRCTRLVHCISHYQARTAVTLTSISVSLCPRTDGRFIFSVSFFVLFQTDNLEINCWELPQKQPRPSTFMDYTELHRDEVEGYLDYYEQSLRNLLNGYRSYSLSRCTQC